LCDKPLSYCPVRIGVRPNQTKSRCWQSGFGGGGHSLDFRFLYGVVNSFLNSGLGVEAIGSHRFGLVLDHGKVCD